MSPNAKSSTLFVGDLSVSCTEEILHDLFVSFGRVCSVRIMQTRKKMSLGYAFVDMGSVESAVSAMENINGLSVCGRNIRIAFATDSQGSNRAYSSTNTMTPGAISASGNNNSARSPGTTKDHNSNLNAVGGLVPPSNSVQAKGTSHQCINSIFFRFTLPKTAIALLAVEQALDNVIPLSVQRVNAEQSIDELSIRSLFNFYCGSDCVTDVTIRRISDAVEYKKGYGFIHFDSVESCAYALKHFPHVQDNGIYYMLEMSKNLEKQLMKESMDAVSCTASGSNSNNSSSSNLNAITTNSLSSGFNSTNVSHEDTEQGYTPAVAQKLNLSYRPYQRNTMALKLVMSGTNVPTTPCQPTQQTQIPCLPVVSLMSSSQPSIRMLNNSTSVHNSYKTVYGNQMTTDVSGVSGHTSIPRALPKNQINNISYDVGAPIDCHYQHQSSHLMYPAEDFGAGGTDGNTWKSSPAVAPPSWYNHGMEIYPASARAMPKLHNNATAVVRLPPNEGPIVTQPTSMIRSSPNPTRIVDRTTSSYQLEQSITSSKIPGAHDMMKRANEDIHSKVQLLSKSGDSISHHENFETMIFSKDYQYNNPTNPKSNGTFVLYDKETFY